MVRDLRGVVLDLDDTLMLERDYVRSGFRAVARAVAEASGSYVARSDHINAATAAATRQPARSDRAQRVEDDAFALLWNDFQAGVRGDAFDRLLAAVPQCPLTVPDLVRVYREHRPDVGLVPGIPGLLDSLAAQGIRLGVISDGPLVSQAAKRDALELSRWFDPVLLTDAWGRACWKPNPFAYQEIERTWDLTGAQLVYVGDNPVKDFDAPNALGWLTIRLVLPGQVRGDLADGDSPAQLRVGSVDELRSALLG